ncbi:MAG: polymorphic toxin-type HINT domain-containing protein [Planctomycetota bacterium]
MKKKIFLSGLATVFLCLLFVVSVQSDTPYRYVKVEGRQLLVDFDMDGNYEPFFTKGVGYSPMPIGRHVSDWGYPEGDPRIDNILDDLEILERDFDLLQQMGVNSIRLWKGDDTEDAGGRFPIKLTSTTLDLAEAHGIKVIPGFWIDTPGPWCDGSAWQYNPPDFLDSTNPNFSASRITIINRFKTFVNNFKDHPAILFWAIGNENNYKIPLEGIPPQYIPAWYSLINQMAYEAHRAEDSTYPTGKNYHPVAIVNGDINNIGEHGALDSQMPDLDIWGANVYRGQSFGTLFRDYAFKSAKPLWISEFGVDAWYTNSYTVRPDGFYDGSDGIEFQAAQAKWNGGLWDEIVLNSNICIGAAVMEYSDEWWKPYEWMCDDLNKNGYCDDDDLFFFATWEKFGYGPLDTSCPRDGVADWIPPAPDKFFNEEWFGIMSIEKNGQPYAPDIMTSRQVYYSLQARFECGENGTGIYYAGSDNNKSCDRTDACCSSPDLIAQNSGCVTVCKGDSTGCFLAGTPILMADGSSKPIEDIKVGDIVLAFDQESGEMKPDKVSEIFRHPKEDTYLVINGHLKVTPIHPVLSKGKWVSIGDLKVGDSLTNTEGKDVPIKTITVAKELVDIYNFEVNPYHTYVADGYIVHNRKPNIKVEPTE